MKMAVESLEMAPWAIPQPGKVPEHRHLSPESCLRRRRSYGTFRGWRLDDLGFSRWRDLIGGRAMSGGGPGAHTLPGRDQRRGAPRGGVSTSWPSSVSALDSVFVSEKIGTLAFVRSRSENISCVTFLKPKTAENRNWHCGILSIG